MRPSNGVKKMALKTLLTEQCCYNDGVATVCRAKERTTEFGAKRNVTSLADLIPIVKLAFAEQSRRQQDLEFAEQQGFSLSLKIRTRLVTGVDNKCKCVIGGYLYDVSYLDRTRAEMYLYLEGVGEIAERNP